MSDCYFFGFFFFLTFSFYFHWRSCSKSPFLLWLLLPLFSCSDFSLGVCSSSVALAMASRSSFSGPSYLFCSHNPVYSNPVFMPAYLDLLHYSPSLPCLQILSSPNTNELFILELMGVHSVLIIMLQNCLYSRWLKNKKRDYFFAQPQKISCNFSLSTVTIVGCLQLRASKMPLLVWNQPSGYSAHLGYWGIVT